MRRNPVMQQQHVQVTKTHTVPTQVQSTETIRIMLFSSMSILFHRRSLFPKSAYDEVVVQEPTVPPRYQDFILGDRQHSASAATDGNYTSAQLLRRGRSSKADSFLDILENGIFDALQRKVLSAIQVNIISDSDRKDNVLETYTFTIKYNRSDDSGREAVGLQLESSEDTSLKEGHIHENLLDFLDHMDDQLDYVKLKTLPENRYMTAYLRYVDNCDDTYEPPGFGKTHDKSVVFPIGNGWQKCTESMTSTGGPFHDISLKMSYLSHESDHIQPAGRGARKPLYCSSFEDMDIDDPVQFATLRPTSRSGTTPQPQHNPSTPKPSTGIQGSDLASPGRPRVEQVSSTPRTAMDLDPATESEAESQIEERENAAPGHDVLRRCLDDSPPQVDCGKQMTDSLRNLHLIQSQSAGRSESSSQVEEDLQMQRALRDVLSPATGMQYSMPTQSRTKVPGKAQHKSVMTPGEDEERFLEKFHYLRHAHALLLWNAPRQSGQVNPPAGSVRCECGFRYMGGDMITCEMCGAVQHAQCYGCLGVKDPRRLEHHVCYECLLSTTLPELFSKLMQLAQLRQTMHLLLVEGLLELGETALSDRASELGLDSAVLTTYIEGLINRSDLVRIRSTQRHSQGEDLGKLRIAAMAQGKKSKRKLLELFDPLDAVHKLYSESVSNREATFDEALDLLPVKYPVLKRSYGKASLTYRKRAMSPPVEQAEAAKGRSTKVIHAQQIGASTSSDPSKRRDVASDDQASSILQNPPTKKQRAETSPRMAVRRSPRRLPVGRTSAMLQTVNVSSSVTPGRAGARDEHQWRI